MVRGHRRSGEEGHGHPRRAHDGAAVQREGPLPALVRQRRLLLHRHHDERRDHLRSRSGDRRRGPPADRHRALPDDPTSPRARRRQHRSRGDLRPRHGRVPAERHPPGLARRLVLGARTGLGAVRVRDGLRPFPGRTLPRHRRALRGLLPGSDRGRRHPSERLGGTGSAASLRILCGRDRGQRSVAACRPHRGSGSSRSLSRCDARDPEQALVTRIPGDRRSRLGGDPAPRRLPRASRARRG